jgi:AraC-like DNA-binding protein
MGVQGSLAVFATRDTVEGLDVLQEVFGLRATPAQADGPFSLALSWAGEGTVRYGRVRLGGPSALAAEHDPRVIRVGQVLDGAGGSTGIRGRLPRRGPFLFSPGLWPGYWEDLDLLTVCLDAAAVEDHARQLLGSASFCLRFTGTCPVNGAMARYWLGAVAHLHRDLLPNLQVMANPLLRAEGVRSLTTALLHTFPSTFLTPPTPHDPAAVPGAVARAVAFIDAHLGQDITVAQIAAAARMSPRGLQAAFRREKDTTPIAHLREARLEAAHRDLLAADPTTGATVAAIADRWRLHHRGRFAAAYRARYGQDPAITLRS